MVFLSRVLDGQKGEDRLDIGNDLIPSTIGGFRGVGIESRRSYSTNEGSVIIEMSSDRFDPRSKVPPEWVTFPSEGVERSLGRE